MARESTVPDSRNTNSQNQHLPKAWFHLEKADLWPFGTQPVWIPEWLHLSWYTQICLMQMTKDAALHSRQLVQWWQEEPPCCHTRLLETGNVSCREPGVLQFVVNALYTFICNRMLSFYHCCQYINKLFGSWDGIPGNKQPGGFDGLILALGLGGMVHRGEGRVVGESVVAETGSQHLLVLQQTRKQKDLTDISDNKIQFSKKFIHPTNLTCRMPTSGLIFSPLISP